MDIASAEGLEGLTIGRLARELRMSKSGLFAHFGSKEELQLATVDSAAQIFVEKVVRPAMSVERGLVRLHAMLKAWISYVERSVFRGGCFFAAASAEFDGRPGSVRKRIVALTKSWVDALEVEVREAQSRGEMGRSIQPPQFAFEVHAFVQEANWAYQLLRDRHAFDRAQAAIRAQLRDAATPSGLALLRRRPTARVKRKK